ncbi:MAG TPA: hypothetical protein VE439_05440 [Anaerolineae bacterium]|nr:hypothetical protein [Anaerolineae bacterium]
MRPEKLSLDQCIREPGVYYDPEEGVIIRISKVSPLLQHAEELAAAKKGGQPTTLCIKVSLDPGLNDDEIERIIRARQL